MINMHVHVSVQGFLITKVMLYYTIQKLFQWKSYNYIILVNNYLKYWAHVLLDECKLFIILHDTYENNRNHTTKVFIIVLNETKFDSLRASQEFFHQLV